MIDFGWLTYREMRRRAAILEKACESALQGGVCGVRVDDHGLQGYAAAPDPAVPYGRIEIHLDH